MSKLDQFFKKKLNDRAFNYEADAWEGMEDLLDAIPEKKSQRPWWLLLVAVLGIGGFLYINSGNKSAEKAVNEKLAEHSSGEELKSDKLNITKDNTVENKSIEGNKQTKIGEEIPGHEKTILEVKDNEKKNSINPAGIKSVDDIASSPKIENHELLSENNQAQKVILNEQKITVAANSSSELEREKNGIRIKQEVTTGNEILTDAKSTDFVAATAEQSPIENKTVNVPSASASSSQDNMLVEEHLEKEAQLFALLLPKRDELKSALNPFEFPTQPSAFSAFKTLRFGIFAEQSFLLPFTKNREVSISNLGPIVQFELNKKWQIQTGLLYKYIKNNVVSIDSVDVNSFGFGRRQTTYHRQVEALHYLGWQGLLERRFNLLRIGLGLEIDANLTAFGSLRSKQSAFPWESDQTAPITEAKGIVSSDFVSRLMVAPQLKISYEVARNTALSLGIKYQLQDYLKTDANKTFPLWTEKSLQFKVGLTYYFINRKKRINER